MRGAPRADLLAVHAHVLAAAVVANRVKVVNHIHAAVQQVSVQCLVDGKSNTTVNNNGVAVRVVVCFADRISLTLIGSHVERFVQLAGLAAPVRLVKIVGLRTVDRVVGDHVGVAPCLENRVSVAEVGHGGLDGLTARR